MNPEQETINSTHLIVELAQSHFKEILDKQEKDITDYMNEYMTQEELNRHGDNIWYMLAKSQSSLAFFQLKLMANKIPF
jgi:hypothetical protein